VHLGHVIHKGKLLMLKAKFLLLIPILLMVTGCTIPSKNLVGLQEYPVDPQQMDGTWINSDGAVVLRVVEPEKGIVRMIFLEDKETPEIFTVKIMKGKSWLYFNLLSEKNQAENMFLWGKVSIEKNKIIAWLPSDNAFIKAIAEGKLLGTVKPPCLADSAKNIIELVESSEKTFFEWEEPMLLIKLAK
jgi:hypothetical protein